MTAVVLLATHLDSDNARELLTAAEHKTKAEIEQLLAERFPKPDVPARLRALPVSRKQTMPATVECPSAPESAKTDEQLMPASVGCAASAKSASSGEQLMPASVAAPVRTLKPLAPKRFALQVTVDQRTHDKLRYVQSLLGHRVPSGDFAQVLDLALDALAAKLEKQRFAATDRPRHSKRQTPESKRTIPARVKRAVWKRNGGQCTFVGETGHRCGARTLVEFDHIDPVARGGQATVMGIRLRCRAHNQHKSTAPQKTRTATPSREWPLQIRVRR